MIIITVIMLFMNKGINASKRPRQLVIAFLGPDAAGLKLNYLPRLIGCLDWLAERVFWRSEFPLPINKQTSNPICRQINSEQELKREVGCLLLSCFNQT